MNSFNRILQMMSVASVIALAVVGCGKSDGGNAQASYALVNGSCTNTQNHTQVAPQYCSATSASYTSNGNQCVNRYGQPVSPSYCQVNGYGGYPNGGYPNGGYPNGGYPNGGYPNGGYPNGGYNPNACVGYYMWYNYSSFVRVYCSGYDCAGYQLYDMQGRLVMCQ